MQAEDRFNSAIKSGRESDTTGSIGVKLIDSRVWRWRHFGKGGAYCAYLEEFT